MSTLITLCPFLSQYQYVHLLSLFVLIFHIKISIFDLKCPPTLVIVHFWLNLCVLWTCYCWQSTSLSTSPSSLRPPPLSDDRLEWTLSNDINEMDCSLIDSGDYLWYGANFLYELRKWSNSWHEMNILSLGLLIPLK